MLEKPKLKSIFRRRKPETHGKEIVLEILCFDDLYVTSETFTSPETWLSCCQLRPLRSHTVISTAWCSTSSSFERLWDWWLHVNLSNFGVCSKLVWKTEHTGKEEIQADNIHLNISLRIFVAQLFMGKFSFQIKLYYLYFILQNQDCFPSVSKAQGPMYFTCLQSNPLPNRS